MKRYDRFFEDFKLIFVNNAALMSHVHKIRYEIFCKELGRKENGPEKIEEDEFDTYSFHYLLQHKPSRQYAGTMRMVLPPSNNPDLLTPIEKYCLNAVDPNIINISKLPRGSFAEVSRLAVPKIFRNHTNNQKQIYTTSTNSNFGSTASNQYESPHASIGLYLTAAALFVLNQLDYIFIMIEPKLAHLLTHVGLHFEQMGEVVEYHGQRAPYYITPERLKKHLKPELKSLYYLITQQINNDLHRNHAYQR